MGKFLFLADLLHMAFLYGLKLLNIPLSNLELVAAILFTFILSLSISAMISKIPLPGNSLYEPETKCLSMESFLNHLAFGVSLSESRWKLL